MKKAGRYWFVVLALLTLFLSSNFHHDGQSGWKKFEKQIFSDKEGYLMYLPATLIYHGFDNYPVRTPQQFYKYKDTDKYFTKYTYGVALLNTPFFLVANLFADDYETSAGQKVYGMGVIAAAIFYLLLGIWLLRLYLRRRGFSEQIIFFTVMCLFFGTNLYFYSVGEGGMSHVYSFCLFSALLLLLDHLYQNPKTKYFILLGLIFGTIVLIRPTNILLGLLILFYDIGKIHTLKERMLFWLKKWPYLLMSIGVAFLVMVPQLIYWHYISGNWIMYSYGNEGFIYWKKARIAQVLFSVQNGLFIYNPILAISFIGLFMMLLKNKMNSRLILIIVVIATYSFASWWAWWFGGAYGHRAFVEFYALLSIPTAYFLQKVSNHKWLKIVVTVFAVCAIYWNLQLIYAYTADWDGARWT